MAKCVKCGWTEKDHYNNMVRGWLIYFPGDGDPRKTSPGRRKSLNACGGYTAPKARPRKYIQHEVLVIIDGVLVDIGS